MKRSDINSFLREAGDFAATMRFALPPFARWAPEECASRRESAREIFDLGLGWDITDFGFGEFERRGLLLFTIRNGSANGSPYPKSYAEKILIVRPGQLTPTHCHWRKTEDIINRGGGDLVLKLHNAAEDDSLADTAVRVAVDGSVREVPPGGEVRLKPGESITLTPRLFHSFWADADAGTVLVGEVSSVNDDRTDNCYHGEQLRFPVIEEDEKPWRLLVSDYPKFFAEQ